MAPDVKEHLLNEVLGNVVSSDHSAREAAHARVMLAKQALERFGIADANLTAPLQVGGRRYAGAAIDVGAAGRERIIAEFRTLGTHGRLTCSRGTELR
jgi:hypothetical protein